MLLIEPGCDIMWVDPPFVVWERVDGGMIMLATFNSIADAELFVRAKAKGALWASETKGQDSVPPVDWPSFDPATSPISCSFCGFTAHPDNFVVIGGKLSCAAPRCKQAALDAIVPSKEPLPLQFDESFNQLINNTLRGAEVLPELLAAGEVADLRVVNELLRQQVIGIPLARQADDDVQPDVVIGE